MKPKPKVEKRSAKFHGLGFFDKEPQIKWRLEESFRPIRAAAEKLSVNRARGEGLELPSEKHLRDFLDALYGFREISLLSPSASLWTLAAEADEMWESLRLRERIKRLAANVKPWVIESPLKSVRKDAALRGRLHELLRGKANATESDLEILILLLPDPTRKNVTIVAKTAQTRPARIALARICADLLRGQYAQHAEQQRLLKPLNHFFDRLGNLQLREDAGLISGPAHAWLKKAHQHYLAHERKKRSRLKRRKAPGKA